MSGTVAQGADRQQRELFWLFAIALLVLGAGYGLRDPWPADEPRFVLVAQQMLDSGQWLFPHRGQELYPDKPPLYFWLLAACRAVIGSWRWSFLLPSLLSGLGVLWLTYDIGRRLWNHRAGLWAAIAVLSALQFVYQFKRAQIDPTLTLATTLALYGLCRHLLLGPNWRWYWAACFAAGLGVILKGVGFLPLLALLPFVLMRRYRWAALAPIDSGQVGRWLLGAVAFFFAIALWLLPMLVVALTSGDAEHRAYLDNLLVKQTATRYTDAWHHHKPFWYFAGVVAVFWMPLSLALPWLWRDWRDAWRQRDARTWLPLAWAVLVLLFFSASPGKRDMYILPALPALALAAAPFIAAIVERTAFRRVLVLVTVGIAALLAGVGLAALSGRAEFAHTLQVERGLGGRAALALWLMLVGVGLAGLLAAAWFRVRRAPAAMAVLLVALWSGYGFIVHPAIDPSSSARALMQRARLIAGPEAGIGLVGWKEQNLLQAVGPTTEFGFRKPMPEQLRLAAAWLDADPARRLLLSQPRGQATCFERNAGVIEVGSANRRDWFLVPRRALSVRCFGAGLESAEP